MRSDTASSKEGTKKNRLEGIKRSNNDSNDNDADDDQHHDGNKKQQDKSVTSSSKTGHTDQSHEHDCDSEMRKTGIPTVNLEDNSDHIIFDVDAASDDYCYEPTNLSHSAAAAAAAGSTNINYTGNNNTLRHVRTITTTTRASRSNRRIDYLGGTERSIDDDGDTTTTTDFSLSVENIPGAVWHVRGHDYTTLPSVNEDHTTIVVGDEDSNGSATNGEDDDVVLRGFRQSQEEIDRERWMEQRIEELQNEQREYNEATAATARQVAAAHVVDAQNVTIISSTTMTTESEKGKEDHVILPCNLTYPSVWVLLVMFIVGCGGIISMIVIISSTQSGPITAIPVELSPSPTETPTTQPSSAPTVDVMDAIRELILSKSKNITNMTFLMLPNNGSLPKSPQYEALYWLVNDDEQRLAAQVATAAQNPSSLTSSSLQINKLIERYALAVLFYSTDDEGPWWGDGGWFSSSDVCQGWEGIQCTSSSEQFRFVSSINLTEAGLDGSIPGEIGLLGQHLTYLKLKGFSSTDGQDPENIHRGLHITLPTEMGFIDQTYTFRFK